MEAATANVDDELVTGAYDAPGAGFSVLARSLAEASFADFPRIDVPMLALYAVHEERPTDRADAHRAPAGTIAMLPGVCNSASGAAPDRFSAEVLAFLRAHT